MTQKKILALIETLKLQGSPIILPEEIWAILTPEFAEDLVRLHGSSCLVVLPEKEQLFFAWLRETNYNIWEDLWGGDEVDYSVGFSFMPQLIEKKRGFPICDLLANDNYYFAEEHCIPGISADYLEAVRNRLLNNQKLTVAQLLMLEISQAPIDIWRFSYLHNILPEQAKKAVLELVDDGVIIHLKSVQEINAYWEL